MSKDKTAIDLDFFFNVLVSMSHLKLYCPACMYQMNTKTGKIKKKKKEPLFNLVKGGEEICTDKKKWNITGDFV